VLGGWDGRYHGPDGALSCVTGLQASTANLSTWVGGTLGGALRPLRSLLTLAGPIGALIAPVATQIQALVGDLAGKVTQLLTGPGSVGAIKGAIDGLVARLHGLNLNFLTQSLGDVFHTVRAKLEALSPAALKGIVDKAFNDMLGTLDLGLILPAADVAALDADYHAVIAKLQALDPKKLVIDVVQPQFDTKVKPLIQAFDLAAALDAVSQMLQRLKGDLRTELGKVNDAYKAMLAAAPSMSPMAIVGDVVGAIGGAIGGDIGSLF
jgi:hypothetical protein